MYTLVSMAPSIHPSRRGKGLLPAVFAIRVPTREPPIACAVAEDLKTPCAHNALVLVFKGITATDARRSTSSSSSSRRNANL